MLEANERKRLFAAKLLATSSGLVVLHHIIEDEGCICSPDESVGFIYCWKAQAGDVFPLIWSPFNLHIETS
jgi:hypothetical protein